MLPAKSISFAILALLFTSCHTSYQTKAVQYHDYSISQGQKDEKIGLLLKPYADSVNKSMNDIVGIAAVDLERGQPENSLGNLIADILFNMAERIYNTSVDVAVMNHGGIRLPVLAAGNITRGKIFEILPFDNTVVLLRLTGAQLQSLLDHTAVVGGWPVSGITMQIKNKKAINIMIHGKPLENGSMYSLATLDYIANGGEDAEMLRSLPRKNTGYIFRDGIFDYLSTLKKKGIAVSSKIENRVINVQ
jgi:2',3'-cyclic-nucleotide 2'-phosphodiesterase (5'-nucleotidase family)